LNAWPGPKLTALRRNHTLAAPPVSISSGFDEPATGAGPGGIPKAD